MQAQVAPRLLLLGDEALTRQIAARLSAQFTGVTVDTASHWPVEAAHSVGLTLLCTTPEARATRAELQAALLHAGQPFGVATGADAAACAHMATRAWQAHLNALTHPAPRPSLWRHACARCGDGDCERRLFQDLHGRQHQGQ